MKKTIFVLVLIPCFLLMAESFVIKKKKPKLSSSKLKEHCCDESVRSVRLGSQLIKKWGALQERYVENASDLFENNKSNSLVMATKDKLDTYRKKLKNFNDHMEQLIDEFDKQLIFMNKY